MPSAQKTLFVLTGPTAVGKTDLSLAWAERHDADILSCDSLLFYRGLDIGTAKPSAEEQSRVRHHLIDIVDLAERMDVARFVKLAQAAVREISERGRKVLVVGGSGFYLKAFFAPVADDVHVPEAMRAELLRQFDSVGLEPLLAELRRLNPMGIGTLDTKNPRRVLRAIERCRASGLTLTALANEFQKKPAAFVNWSMQLTRLDRDAVDLESRIVHRIEAMVRNGLVEETERLLKLGLGENASASRAIGYRETIAMLSGQLSRAELIPAIASNTRALVKKQRTWFRTQLPPHRSVAADTCSPEQLFV